MRLSIILVVYNGLRYLPDCLSSLVSECLDYADSEVIVVDNASNDGSPEWIAANYPQLRLLRNTQNLGYAAGSNQGAAVANGEVLVILNQDTRVLTGWLKALMNGLSYEQDVGLSTSKLLLMSQPDRIHLCGQDVHYTGLSFGRGTLDTAGSYTQPHEVAAVSGASFAIRKTLWEQLGGFDETFFMYYEETDLCWRASLLGFSSWYIPDSLALHDAVLTPSPRAMYYSVRNRPILLVKHWKWATLIFMLPAIWLSELIEWIYAGRLGWRYLYAKLRAAIWLLRHPGQILKARCEAQATRTVSDASLLRKCIPQITPQVLSFNPIGQAWLHITNFLLVLNYRVAIKLAQWLKI